MRLDGLVQLENVEAIVIVALAEVTGGSKRRIYTSRHRYRYCLIAINLDGNGKVDHSLP